MKKILNDLLSYKSCNDILPPINENEIYEFEKDNKISLPVPLLELLKKFDGGEILIPGPTIYGIKRSSSRKTIREINSKESRSLFNIPNNYLIISKLNYGDFICINLNHPYDIIQWEHETDSIFCSWNSVEEWLADNLSSFEKYKEENE